jgi:hypothetical protein
MLPGPFLRMSPTEPPVFEKVAAKTNRPPPSKARSCPATSTTVEATFSSAPALETTQVWSWRRTMLKSIVVRPAPLSGEEAGFQVDVACREDVTARGPRKRDELEVGAGGQIVDIRGLGRARRKLKDVAGGGGKAAVPVGSTSTTSRRRQPRTHGETAAEAVADANKPVRRALRPK